MDEVDIYSYKNEVPTFDCGEWTACTRHGMCWWLFKDRAKNTDPSLFNEAVKVVEKIIETGQPPFGGWR